MLIAAFGQPTGESMDLLDVIRSDHQELREQLAALAETASTDPEESVDLFYTFRQNLTAHHQAEEQLVFGRLRDLEDAAEIIDLAWEQHAAIELYVQRMHRSHKMVRWQAKANLLRALTEQHLAGEEETVFRLVRRWLTDELDPLAERFEQENRRLLALIPI